VADDLTPIWMRPERPARGPQPSHSRAEIVAKAIAIADAEGIDAVSMRRLASEVGTGTMSLYRYIPKKDDLYELMIDAVAGEDPPPERPSGDWRADLRLIAHRQLASARRHPWLVSLSGRPVFGPNTLRLAEFGFSALDGLGLSIDGIMEIVSAVTAFVTGVAQNELGERELRRRTGVNEEEWRRAQAPYIQSILDSGKFPHMNRIVIEAEIPHSDPDKVFARVLDRLLDGLAAGIGHD